MRRSAACAWQAGFGSCLGADREAAGQMASLATAADSAQWRRYAGGYARWEAALPSQALVREGAGHVCPFAAPADNSGSGASGWAILPGEQEFGAGRCQAGDARLGTGERLGRRGVQRDHRCARTAADAVAARAEVAARFIGLRTAIGCLLCTLRCGRDRLAPMRAADCRRLAMSTVVGFELPCLRLADEDLGAHHRRGNAGRRGHEDRHQAKKPKADEFHAHVEKECQD